MNKICEYIIVKTKNSYAPILKNGNNFSCHCGCVTGTFGGWNYRAVIDHATKYSTSSNARRAVIRQTMLDYDDIEWSADTID